MSALLDHMEEILCAADAHDGQVYQCGHHEAVKGWKSAAAEGIYKQTISRLTAASGRR